MTARSPVLGQMRRPFFAALPISARFARPTAGARAECAILSGDYVQFEAGANTGTSQRNITSGRARQGARGKARNLTTLAHCVTQREAPTSRSRDSALARLRVFLHSWLKLLQLFDW